MAKDKIKILVLTGDAPSLSRLNVGKEGRQIAHEIWGSEYRDRFQIEFELAVRRAELISLLARHRPNVVHFAGHGSEDGRIFLLSDDDKHLPLSADALKAIFAEFNETVRLVFLNACFTAPEAKAIAEVVESAVGTAKTISDRAAIAFASTFYSCLGNGFTIGQAFNLGKAQLLGAEWQGEGEISLLSRPDIDPYRTRLIETVEPSVPASVPDSSLIETDPTGRLYLSCAPSRMYETQLIALALRDRGIPLSEEALSSDRHLMDGLITEVLQSPGTSGALISLTPEAVDSQAVKSIELPLMLNRAGKGNSFFIIPTQTSDVDSGEVGVQLRSRGFQIHKLTKKKVGPTEAGEIARFALEKRISAIHKTLPKSDPLRVELYTRAQPPLEQGTALVIDWTERFKPRLATADAWTNSLLPALRDIVRVIETKAPGRVMHLDGRPSLPAVIAFGCAFIQPKGIKVGWTQHTSGRPDQMWSIDAGREPCGITVDTNSYQPDGSDLAVLVSITASVEQAFELSRPELPPFRAMVRAWKTPFGTDSLVTAGQAADAAFKIRDAVRDARTNYPRLGVIHLFMAVPSGLAMMIGQLLNVLGPVQTYDLESADSTGRYRPAVVLRPCD